MFTCLCVCVICFGFGSFCLTYCFYS